MNTHALGRVASVAAAGLLVVSCYDDAPPPRAWERDDAAVGAIDAGATIDVDTPDVAVNSACGPAPEWSCTTDCTGDSPEALECVDGTWRCEDESVPSDACELSCPLAPARCCDDAGVEIALQRCDGPMCGPYDDSEPFDGPQFDEYCGGLWKCATGSRCTPHPCGPRRLRQCASSCESLNEVLEVCVGDTWQCPDDAVPLAECGL